MPKNVSTQILTAKNTVNYLKFSYYSLPLFKENLPFSLFPFRRFSSPGFSTRIKGGTSTRIHTQKSTTEVWEAQGGARLWEVGSKQPRSPPEKCKESTWIGGMVGVFLFEMDWFFGENSTNWYSKSTDNFWSRILTYCSCVFWFWGYVSNTCSLSRRICWLYFDGFFWRKTDPPKLGQRLTYLWIPNLPRARCFREAAF